MLHQMFSYTNEKDARLTNFIDMMVEKLFMLKKRFKGNIVIGHSPFTWKVIQHLWNIYFNLN